MDKKHIAMAALVAIISSLIVFLPVAQASGVKEPSYRIMKEDGKVEIREYQPYIVAQVAGTGDFQGAMYSGFMKLFNYISGKNTNRSKIKMTVPVTEEQVTVSEKIPMTAPVTQEKSGNLYIISFIMPENYRMDTLPIPDDRSVTFRQVPAHKAAVLKFSGRMKQDVADKKIAELKAYLAKNGLEARSNFMMAQYNPPWIPGFMRRNEVIVEV
jgi:DNA gyrase inhibitor GyrI